MTWDSKNTTVGMKIHPTNGCSFITTTNRIVNTEGDEANLIGYSVCAEWCTIAHHEIVRKHLDSGVLAKLITKKREGYVLILLGACAMTLGCTLPLSFEEMLKKNFKHVGLMRDSLKQMNKALNGPNRYVNGVPYCFRTIGLETAMDRGGAPTKDRINKVGVIINVPSPGGLPPLPNDAIHEVTRKMAESGVDVQERMEVFAKNELPQGQPLFPADALKDTIGFLEKKYYGGENACGGCGAKEREGGGPLLHCNRCKMVKYCGKKCQAEHWDVHKKMCPKPKGVK